MRTIDPDPEIKTSFPRNPEHNADTHHNKHCIMCHVPDEKDHAQNKSACVFDLLFKHEHVINRGR